MGEDCYARAQAIVHEVLERPLHERQACLAAHCGSDPALRREVEWLIRAAEDTAHDDVPELIARTAAELAQGLHINAASQARYRLIERIGEGGMGVVWLAERDAGGVSLRVALKRLRFGSFAQQARFQEEQRILASLNHPNIAYLIDAGSDAEGQSFLAMEYVDGERIDRWCQTHSLDVRGRIGLFLKVCAAVSYAHERLVIHRDIKPANLLVDAAGEPKLLDFGIARLLDGNALLVTATQAMTPAYASPEQIEGNPLGTRSDVWSLGVVLYELLAGVRPFEHLESDHERASAILSGVVTPPSRRIPRVASDRGQASTARPKGVNRIPADLDAIVLKALRREPEQRYASVQEMSDDLGHFLAARPVMARRGRWSYRARLFVRRNRWLLSAGFTLFALIAGFTWRTFQAEREARLQAEVAERTTEFLVSAFSLSDPTRAERHDFTAREVLDRGRDRVDEELAQQPRVHARLLEALGNAYRGINEDRAGASLLEEAARLYLDPAVDDPLAAVRSPQPSRQSAGSPQRVRRLRGCLAGGAVGFRAGARPCRNFAARHGRGPCHPRTGHGRRPRCAGRGAGGAAAARGQSCAHCGCRTVAAGAVPRRHQHGRFLAGALALPACASPVRRIRSHPQQSLSRDVELSRSGVVLSGVARASDPRGPRAPESDRRAFWRRQHQAGDGAGGICRIPGRTRAVRRGRIPAGGGRGGRFPPRRHPQHPVSEHRVPVRSAAFSAWRVCSGAGEIARGPCDPGGRHRRA